MVAPLSITTSPRSPYDDEVGADGFLRYRYRGTDPEHPDNVGLRRAWRLGLPLVYFAGITVGQYQAFWPVFIHDDEPAALTFTVAFDEPQQLRPNLSSSAIDEARRSYVTRLAVQRLHQAKFRQRVIAAYRTTCAICRLRHGELLDARDLRAVLALGVQGLRGAHDASLPPSASGGGGSRTRVSRVFGGASPSAAGE